MKHPAFQTLIVALGGIILSACHEVVTLPYTYTGSLAAAGNCTSGDGTDESCYGVQVPMLKGDTLYVHYYCKSGDLKPAITIQPTDDAESKIAYDTGCAEGSATYVAPKTLNYYVFIDNQDGGGAGEFTLTISSSRATGKPVRINSGAADPIAIYCSPQGLDIYQFVDGVSSLAIRLPYDQMVSWSTSEENTLIDYSDNLKLYRLSSGEWQAMKGPDSEGKMFVALWQDCDQSTLKLRDY
jgi:hypothetical protein